MFPSASPWHKRYWYALAASAAAILATALIYWSGLSGPFLLDDGYNIPQTRISELSWQELDRVLLDNRSGVLRRPVSVLSFALNHVYLGEAPFGFKLVNLLLHISSAILLCWLGARLLQDLDQTNQRAMGSGRNAWLVAGALALWWAVHPLQVSTVLYTVQRMAMLASFFTVAALLCYAIARRRLIEGKGGVLAPSLLLGVFALLALLSKESGALVVFYIAAIETVVYRLRSADVLRRRKVHALLAVYCVLPILLGVAYFFTHLDSLLQNYAVRSFTLGERLLTQPGVLWYYVKLVLLPDISAMSVFHDDFPVARLNLVSIAMALSIPATLAAALLLRSRAPVLTLGVLWYLASHVIESTVFPLELVFEHRNYLAIWGVLLPVIYYVLPAGAYARAVRVRIACLTLFSVLLAFQTHTRAHTWSDFDLLAAVTAHEHPHSARARHTYSQSLLLQHQIDAALNEARAAGRLDQRHPGYPMTVILIECVRGHVQATTIELSHEALAKYSMNAHSSALMNKLIQLASSERCDGFDKHTLLYLAEAAAERAQQDTHSSRRSAALAYLAIAQSLFPDKNAQAIATFQRAFAADNENISALVAVGQLQFMDGLVERARETLQQAKQQNARNLIDRSHLFSTLEAKLERSQTQ